MSSESEKRYLWVINYLIRVGGVKNFSSEEEEQESTLRLPGLKAEACFRPELRPRGSGLTLSRAPSPRLQSRGLTWPNGSTGTSTLSKGLHDISRSFTTSQGASRKYSLIFPRTMWGMSSLRFTAKRLMFLFFSTAFSNREVYGFSPI